jgi:two-component system cell cycle sensor histidine kinase/response regulator CckA
VAAVPNVRLQVDPAVAAGLALEDIPCSAALLDPSGAIISNQSEWTKEEPAAANAFEWGQRLHIRAALRESLTSGIRKVLEKSEKRFIQDYTRGGTRRRVTVSSRAVGALILHQELGSADGSERSSQSWKLETVGRLASGVAHDFANLLTLIIGYGDILLQRVEGNDPARKEIEEIRNAADRGARLVAQILGFARNQHQQYRPFDLNALVADTARLLHPLIGEHVELQIVLDARPCRVLADFGQMEQMIMNLLLNARDAMPGGGRIRMETHNAVLSESDAREHGMKSGPCALLIFSDTGHGIRKEYIEHLFEPFFTTKEAGKGTGVGLSTVRNIVKEHEGDIWVRSEPGAGATFTVCLPGCQGVAKHHTADTPAYAGTGSETVLLVEDEEGVRRFLNYVLHRSGYKVIEAADGSEALRLFEQHGDEIRLLLTDVIMSGIDGRELAEQILQARPETKVIYMSGYPGELLLSSGTLVPSMAFLQKPLRPESVLAKVREALDSPSRPFNPQ